MVIDLAASHPLMQVVVVGVMMGVTIVIARICVNVIVIVSLTTHGLVTGAMGWTRSTLPVS